MALPGTPGGGQQISMSQINTELGRSATAEISLDTAENGTYATINTCSPYYPAANNPATMNEWHGYNHSASCGGVTYNHYTADKYQCSTCTLVSSGVIVSFPDTESVTINNWYPDGNDIYHSYQITGTYNDGPGYILTNAYGSYSSCSVACSI